MRFPRLSGSAGGCAALPEGDRACRAPPAVSVAAAAECTRNWRRFGCMRCASFDGKRNPPLLRTLLIYNGKRRFADDDQILAIPTRSGVVAAGGRCATAP